MSYEIQATPVFTTRFCTDEILLREMAEDPFLQKYNYVIIDEFQERKTSTDLALALLKYDDDDELFELIF